VVDMSAIDSAIATYRAELAAAAPLADRELDELAGHLRDAIEDRVAAGRSEADAIVEARAQLGAAQTIARECVRVRAGLAVPLAPVRAWAATALVIAASIYVVILDPIAPGLIWGGIDDGDIHNLGLMRPLVLGIGAALLVAMALGRSYARVVVCGYLLGSVVWIADHFVHTVPALYHYTAPETGELHGALLVALCAYGAAAALILPWRRRDFTRQGWAIVLAAAALATPLHSTLAPGWTTQLAVIYGAVALLGLGLRARWGCAVSVLTAGALVATVALATADLVARLQLTTWAGIVRHPTIDTVILVAELVVTAASAAAAVAAAVLGWRHARRGLGDPRRLAI
jgi:hypothetical protein